MAKRGGMILVELVHGVAEIQNLLKLLREIEGVIEADFYYRTRKLMVVHDGSERTAKEVLRLIEPLRARPAG